MVAGREESVAQPCMKLVLTGLFPVGYFPVGTGKTLIPEPTGKPYFPTGKPTGKTLIPEPTGKPYFPTGNPTGKTLIVGTTATLY